MKSRSAVGLFFCWYDTWAVGHVFSFSSFNRDKNFINIKNTNGEHIQWVSSVFLLTFAEFVPIAFTTIRLSNELVHLQSL